MFVLTPVQIWTFDQLCILRPNIGKIIPLFLLSILSSDCMSEQIEKLKYEGVSIQQLHLRDLALKVGYWIY